MIQRSSLASLTLDTLPFNIAVLDEEGTILFVNEAWRDFGGVGSGGGDIVGTNYFAGIDEGDDSHASAAVTGLRRILDGKRDLFKLEYPCHTDERDQWFMMWAARLPDNEEGEIVVAHIDVTQRKLAELEARSQRQALEAITTRIEELVGTVMEAALQAESRADLESTLCQRLVSLDAYTCAWVGDRDRATGTIRPTAVAGTGSPNTDTTLPLDADDPTARALRTGETQVQRAVDDQSLSDIHRRPRTAIERGALAAFPLTYGGTEYGVVTVYASDEDAFGERETTVLDVLARVVSTALDAIERKRLLTSDHVVQLELVIDTGEPFFADIARTLECTLAYEGGISDDGGTTMLFEVQDASPEAVVGAALDHDSVEAVTHVSETETGAIVEFRVTDAALLDTLAEWGVETTDIVAAPTDVQLTVELPARGDVRAVVERLSDRYPSTELVSRHRQERPDKTKQELLTDIETALTERQRHALRKAWLGGFFEWPREVSGEELAESMDISPATYHQHLRSAERKVIAELFEE